MALDLKKKSLIVGFQVPCFFGGTQYILAPAYAAPRSMINDQNITEQPENKCDSQFHHKKTSKATTCLQKRRGKPGCLWYIFCMQRIWAKNTAESMKSWFFERDSKSQWQKGDTVVLSRWLNKTQPRHNRAHLPQTKSWNIFLLKKR